MSSEHPPLVRTRLSIMMFLEFFVWGGWGVAITGYAASVGFSGWQLTLLGAVPAIGAMISPLLVGPIADRFFPAQRVLCVLHLLGGVCLILAGFQKEPFGLTTLMLLNGLFFMPSIALVNAVAFTHIPDPDKFPRIAVLGTVGWIMAIIIASVFLGGATVPNFLFQSGVAGIFLGLYCLTLPNTPPKGAEADGDAFGLKALKLLKEPSLLTFIICVFLVSIPACGYFFTLMVPMLQQRGFPSPLALTSLCQFSELVFMFSMPWFVSKLGLKRVVLIGMVAWALRYVFFACPEFSMALVGLILHGFCYSFFYVGAYMYVDKRAPDDLKSSAQSLLTFLLIGVGWFVGSLGLGTALVTWYPAPVANMAAVVGGEDDRPLPAWNDPEAATSVWRFLDLSGTAKALLFGEEQQSTADMLSEVDTNKDGKITMAEVEAIPDSGVTIGDVEYSRDDIKAVFEKILSLEDGGADSEQALTRKEWLKAQSYDWGPIWLWPAAGVLVVLVFFALGFKDVPTEEQSEQEGQEASGKASSESAAEERTDDPQQE